MTHFPQRFCFDLANALARHAKLPAYFLERAAVAIHQAETLFEHLALTLATSSIPWFTVSFGVVESSFAQTLDDLLVAADVAVSMAKDLGRNRVVVANEELIDPRVEDDL